MHLGSQHGAQNPPKTPPKSMKNRWKMDIKNDENFECILNGFLVALGANMAPKPSQNPSPRRCPIGVLLGPLGVLEGSWGALGASWGPRANFIDFWSIFDRFLIDFASQLGTQNPTKLFKNRCQDAFRLGLHFLIDFWSIFAPNFYPPKPTKH